MMNSVDMLIVHNLARQHRKSSAIVICLGSRLTQLDENGIRRIPWLVSVTVPLIFHLALEGTTHEPRGPRVL